MTSMQRLRPSGGTRPRACRGRASQSRSAMARFEARAIATSRAVGENHGDRVVVAAEADARRADVVGDDGVAALLDQLRRRARSTSAARRRAVSAAKPTRNGRSRRAARRASPASRSGIGAPAPASVAALPSAAPRELARRAGAAGRKSATAAAMTTTSASRRAAVRAPAPVGGGLTSTRARRPAGVGGVPGPATRVTAAPRAAAASASAKPIFPDERLPRKRTSSTGSLRRARRHHD